MEFKSIEDVATEVDIAPTTIRKWDKDFNLNLKRNSKNNRVFYTDDILLLKTIKYLKNKGCGLNTITKKLNLNVDSMSSIKENTLDNKGFYNDLESDKHVTDIRVVDDISLKIDKLADRLEGVLELSEKYSRACYEVGSLKSQLEGEQKEKVLLLKQSDEKTESYAKDINNLNKELTKRELELEAIKQQNELLQHQLQVEKSLPWYKKIFS